MRVEISHFGEEQRSRYRGMMSIFDVAGDGFPDSSRVSVLSVCVQGGAGAGSSTDDGEAFQLP